MLGRTFFSGEVFEEIPYSMKGGVEKVISHLNLVLGAMPEIQDPHMSYVVSKYIGLYVEVIVGGRYAALAVDIPTLLQKTVPYSQIDHFVRVLRPSEGGVRASPRD